jgi:hypothetical protein
MTGLEERLCEFSRQLAHAYQSSLFHFCGVIIRGCLVTEAARRWASKLSGRRPSSTARQNLFAQEFTNPLSCSEGISEGVANRTENEGLLWELDVHGKDILMLILKIYPASWGTVLQPEGRGLKTQWSEFFFSIILSFRLH